ncbi:Eco57I restriction-modification methylase domain-containing protein [Microbacterium maritypicum]|uniref:Eco57I restriction-modification methylase domain-containing protein n=1 Tax=Microbacterium maritypicum TaxID=33918 RepID=UPI00380FCC98
MKTREVVAAGKLRGGFYSPDPLVDVCLDRVRDLIGGREGVTVLEPSAGDGGFIRGLDRHPIGAQVKSITAVEISPAEASKVKESLERSSLDGQVFTGSALDPKTVRDAHDVAIGNPPFVRFQFVTQDDKRHADELGRRIGVSFGGVSNLWIPVFLSALSSLRDGGVFSFIVPAECFTGQSARAVRTWLTQNAAQLRVDLFPPKSFPGVLQEVVVLSGQISRNSTHGANVHVHDHGVDGAWHHVLDDDVTTWTGLLLRPEHLKAFAEARGVSSVVPFREVAKLSVATVTGANSYFCFDEGTRIASDLGNWARPLLDRVRHAPGLAYTEADHAANLAGGHPVWLLDSSLSSKPTAGARNYIAIGEAQELHTRYKTRIRSPWWRVPVVAPGTLMLSKRSNFFPRLIRNAEAVVTTDTVYQGSPLPPFRGRERDIVGSFHNSLTLLTAEMFGRSFGGGVLELVPSETAQLVLPVASIHDDEFTVLDQIARVSRDPEDLVVETDKLVTDRLGIDPDTWDLVRDARTLLRDRRIARN